MVFVHLLWALVTSMVAFASGVNVRINNPKMIRIEGFLIYYHQMVCFIIVTNLADVTEVPAVITWLSAILWTVLPWLWFKTP